MVDGGRDRDVGSLKGWTATDVTRFLASCSLERT